MHPSDETHTRQRADLKAPGVFEAVDPRALVFEPDPTRPTVDHFIGQRG